MLILPIVNTEIIPRKCCHITEFELLFHGKNEIIVHDSVYNSTPGYDGTETKW
jgi:hypothetical protein